jgi:hypothetical protein
MIMKAVLSPYAKSQFCVALIAGDAPITNSGSIPENEGV